MDTHKRDIIAALLKANRPDLANAVAKTKTAGAVPFPFHLPKQSEDDTRKVYTTLHKLKFAMDQMEEIPGFLQPLYDETMKALATVDELFQKVQHLQDLTHKVSKDLYR